MNQDQIRNFCIIAHIGVAAYEETQVSSSGLEERGLQASKDLAALLLPKKSEAKL